MGTVIEINIPFKLDTGAQANILPTSELNRMHPRPKLKRTSTRLTAYNGSNIPVVGELSTPIEIKGKTQTIDFTIVEGNYRPILGLKTCQEMQLVKRVETVQNDLNENP